MNHNQDIKIIFKAKHGANIVSNPAICGGDPVLEGTRVYPETIHEMIEDGDSPARVAHVMKITTQNVRTCLDYVDGSASWILENIELNCNA